MSCGINPQYLHQLFSELVAPLCLIAFRQSLIVGDVLLQTLSIPANSKLANRLDSVADSDNHVSRLNTRNFRTTLLRQRRARRADRPLQDDAQLTWHIQGSCPRCQQLTSDILPRVTSVCRQISTPAVE